MCVRSCQTFDSVCFRAFRYHSKQSRLVALHAITAFAYHCYLWAPASEARKICARPNTCCWLIDTEDTLEKTTCCYSCELIWVPVQLDATCVLQWPRICPCKSLATEISHAYPSHVLTAATVHTAAGHACAGYRLQRHLLDVRGVPAKHQGLQLAQSLPRAHCHLHRVQDRRPVGLRRPDWRTAGACHHLCCCLTWA